MKVWITKYALTGGISCIEGAPSPHYPELFRPTKGMSYFLTNEWHTTEATAIAKAEQMRIAKIASLQKQIAKLEKMTFTPKEG